MSRSDALVFVNEAINALSTEVWRGRSLYDIKEVNGPDCSIAIDLDRIAAAIGPRGEGIFANLAESVRECMVALYAARAALETDNG